MNDMMMASVKIQMKDRAFRERVQRDYFHKLMMDELVYGKMTWEEFMDISSRPDPVIAYRMRVLKRKLLAKHKVK